MNNNSFKKREQYILLFEKYSFLLTQVQKQVLQLKFFEDLSYQEIAHIMATTRAASWDAIQKALTRLDKVPNQDNN